MEEDLGQSERPTASETNAREALTRLGELSVAQRAVAAESSAPAAAWFSGLAAASALYIASLGWIWTPAAETATVGISVVFALSVAALAVTHLRRVRATSAGFSRRFATGMAVWGVLLAASLILGLLFLAGHPAFFLTAAVVVAVPPLWSSNIERSRDGRIGR